MAAQSEEKIRSNCGPNQRAKRQISVQFKDVAIYFSEEAWHLLEDWQKELYKTVMKEIHGALLCLGYTIANPDILFRIKNEEEPYYESDPHLTGQEQISGLPTDHPSQYPDIFLRVEKEEYCDGSAYQNSAKSLHGNNFSTGFPAISSLKLLKQEDEPTPVDFHHSHGRNGILINSANRSPDLVCVIKQEENVHFGDDQSLERKETTTDLSRYDALANSKRKVVRCNEIAGNRMLHLTTSSKTRDCGFWYSDKQNGSRQMVSKVNQTDFLAKKACHPMSNTRFSEPMNPSITNRYHMNVSHFLSHGYNERLIDKSKEAHYEKTHMGTKSFTCNECGKHFAKSLTLFRHQRNHIGDRPLKCTQCEKHFTSAFSLFKHQRSHIGEIRYKCTECEKGFGFLKQLQLHFHHAHLRPRQNLNMDYNKNVSLQNLEHDMHSREKPYIYTDVKKGIAAGLGTIQYQSTRSRNFQHKCTYCGKSFQQRSNLTRHIRIHTGEKPYTCTECDKSFNQSSTLRSHQRCHTGEKPYTCPECGKCYSRLSYLSQHKKIHKRNRSLAKEVIGKHE